MRVLKSGTIAVLSVAVALYAVVAYGFLPLGALVHPEMQASFLAHQLPIYTHVFTASVALLVGPFQFLASVQRRKSLHRVLGRVYVAGVALGGVSGLYLSLFATGGLLARSGFFVLSLVWLATAGQGLRAILAGRVRDHRAWMLRSFALTFAAVTLRLQLGVAMALGVEFLDVYPWLGWTAWLPNLVVAELFLVRRRRARAGGTRAPRPRGRRDQRQLDAVLDAAGPDQRPAHVQPGSRPPRPDAVPA